MQILSFASAHEAEFHSPEELKTHIDQHLAELQAVQHQDGNDSFIRQKCLEIKLHLDQYQKFAAYHPFFQSIEIMRRNLWIPANYYLR